jgi:hypothetical protein
VSRNYAQIFTAIWRDPDFIALRESTQRAYLMLVTQPGISAAGILPLTLRRWAKLAEDSTIASLRADLVLLHRAGMVVVDEDTEELLVRSFVRHDNGYKNPRRQPSIRDAANEVESGRLRRVLADELTRLGCPRWMAEMAPPPVGKPQGADAGADELFPQVNSHSDSQTDSQSDPRADIDGMAIPSATARTTTHNPQPATPSLPSVGTDGDAADAALFAAEPPPKKSTRRKRAPTDDFNASAVVAAFVEGAQERNRKVTQQVIKQVGATAKRIISAGDATEEQLLAAARDMGRAGWKDLNLQLLRGDDQQARMNGGMKPNGHQPYRNPEDHSVYEDWTSR